MFEASLLRSFNIYLVENLSHTLISLGMVIAVLVIFDIRQPASRIKFLLVPIILPALASPLYYLISPNRFGLPVIKVDNWLDVEALIGRSNYSALVSDILTFAILAVGLFLLTKGIISLTAVIWLPRRYPRLSLKQSPQLYSILDRVLRAAKAKWPVVLLYPDSNIVCCAFGFRYPYLLVSKGALERLSPDELEAVVAHEVGHLRRWDGWLGFVVLTFKNILFFNPAVLVLSQRILRNAELAADDLALSFGPSRLAFVESLVKVSRTWGDSAGRAFLIPSHFLSSPTALKARVLHALEENPQATPHQFRWLFSGTVAILLVGLFFIC